MCDPCLREAVEITRVLVFIDYVAYRPVVERDRATVRGCVHDIKFVRFNLK